MNKVFEYASDEGLFLSVQYAATSKTLEIFQNQKETLIEITPLDRIYDGHTKHSSESKMIDIEIDREYEADTTIEIDMELSQDLACIQY